MRMFCFQIVMWAHWPREAAESRAAHSEAMSKSEPCLDILLRGQLHIHDPTPQILGRISWPVVAGMGLRLLRTLEVGLVSRDGGIGWTAKGKSRDVWRVRKTTKDMKRCLDMN